uniref:EGF-like domain-containing protein n=1 Tax=Arcella intermedia TaxID=1963864 RepID=A0A6B2KZJ2_9EUKA
MCTLCYSQSKYGPYCNITCSCQNGLCNSGIDGDGKCAFCNTNYFGLDCSSLCSCVHGVCDGQYGTGVCTSCIGAYSGILCNIPCNCTNGACTNDITGNGLCSSCNSNYYGPTCNRCLCNTSRGTCSSGPGGNGLCSSCRNGYYGPTCNMTANCTNGRVSDGPLGTGVCSSCYSNSFGPTCETCTCVNGTCNAGLGGTGLCTNCIPGFYGPNCDTPCECSAPYTYCNNSASLGGGCVNECKFKTHNCEQLCVSRQTAPNTGWVCGCRDGFRLANDTQCKACTIEFICVNNTVTLSGKNSSTIDTTITGDLKIVSGSVSITNSSVTGTLTVVDSSTQISGSYVVIGGSIITIGSSFNLTGSSVVNVNGNFVLTNGKLDVSGNSFINITGCVDLTNSTLVLQSQGTTSTIKVLETSSNCTVSRFSHVQLADSLTSSCTKATVTDTSTKREISFAVTYDDSACNQFPSWLIGTIAVAGFIVIVISVLLVANSKALKEFFFPFREAPPDYNE